MDDAIIDLRAIASLVIQFAAAVLIPLAGVAAWKISAWLGLKKDNEFRVYLETAFTNGIGLAAQRAAEKAENLANVHVQNRMIAVAADYVASSVPDALKRLEITPEKLQQMVKARFGASDIVPLPDPKATQGAVSSSGAAQAAFGSQKPF